MSSVTIYMEGGGDDPERQAALRRGMENFLQRGLEADAPRPRVIPCGGRSTAYDRFRRRISEHDIDELVVLLVASEQQMTAATAQEHLRDRPEDNWDLSLASDEQIHLMVQTMEAWIVADERALSAYYGDGFKQGALPEQPNLEAVSKRSIANSFRKATENSNAGRYRKIGHASDLLQRIDPETVRQRCPACRRLFETLAREIGE